MGRPRETNGEQDTKRQKKWWIEGVKEKETGGQLKRASISPCALSVWRLKSCKVIIYLLSCGISIVLGQVAVFKWAVGVFVFWAILVGFNQSKCKTEDKKNQNINVLWNVTRVNVCTYIHYSKRDDPSASLVFKLIW